MYTSIMHLDLNHPVVSGPYHMTSHVLISNTALSVNSPHAISIPDSAVISCILDRKYALCYSSN